MLNPGDLDKNGKLIALEGDSEIISTHICLLPPSQKILVFPLPQDCTTKENDPENFDPISFIQDVHAAFTERLNVANSFLQASEPEHPRLVFMNGGSIRARTICIDGICKNITAGDFKAAETIFNDLIKGGLTELLENQEDAPNQSLRKQKPSDQNPNDKIAENVVNDDQKEANKEKDDTTKFTPQINGRRPEMLSLEKKYVNEEVSHVVGDCLSPGSTSSKQGSSPGDGANKIRIPYRFDNVNVHTEKSISFDEDEFVKTTFTLTSREPTYPKDEASMRSPTYLTPKKSTPSVPGAYLQDLIYDSRRSSYTLDMKINDLSFPSTPTTVERMPYTPPKIDNETPMPERSHPAIEINKLSDYAQTSLASEFDLRQRKRPHFLGELNASNFDSFSSNSSQPDNKSLKLISSPGSSSSLHGLAKDNRAFVDKGCNTEESYDEIREVNDEPFVPMFEVVEDIIIHFADSETNPSVNNVLRSSQGGKFPAHRPISWCENITSSKHYSGGLPRPKTSYPKEGTFSVRKNSIHTNYSTIFETKSVKSESFEDRNDLPPTPATTPPKISETNNKTRTKALTFSAANSSNLISAHNCFRRLLSSHLTTGKNGYSQYYQPVPAPVDRTWKPVFGNWNISECVLKKTTIDQIIALGSASTVEDDFKSQIIGLVERLGAKGTGQSRSDKIDISYCRSIGASARILLCLPFIDSGISSVLSSTSSQNSPSPISPNIHSNGAVPSNNGIKNFSKYGNNSNSNQRLDYFVPPSPSTVSNLEAEETFSGADFILSNFASNEEITRFISDIRQILVEKSSFYLPEPEPEPRTIIQVVEKYITAPPLPVTRPSSQHRSSIIEGSIQDGAYRSNSRRQSAKNARHSSNGIHTPLSEFIAKRNYAASIASSRRTCASSISELEGWENFEIGDEESDFDEYDRMILGSKMTALVLGKQFFSGGNQIEISQQGVASKRKALKWLGLA